MAFQIRSKDGKTRNDYEVMTDLARCVIAIETVLSELTKGHIPNAVSARYAMVEMEEAGNRLRGIFGNGPMNKCATCKCSRNGTTCLDPEPICPDSTDPRGFPGDD